MCRRRGARGVANAMVSVLVASCGADGTTIVGDAAPAEALHFQRVSDDAALEAEASTDAPVRLVASTWRFARDGAWLRLELAGPSRVTAGSTLRVLGEAQALDGCDLTVRVVEPVLAARQTAFRGRALGRGDRGLTATSTVAISDGSAELALELPAPWRPEVAELEAEVWCAGQRLRAVAGSRREQRSPERGRVRDEVLAVAAIPIATGTWPLVVPHEPEDDVDGTWPASTVPSLVLADTRRGDALPAAGASASGGAIAAEDTRVGFAWSQTGLLIRATLRDRDLAPREGARDAELWKGDALEVFLAHHSRDVYVELQTAPSGAVFDAAFTARRRGGPEWNGQTAIGVVLHGTLERGDLDTGWDVELLVPWTDLRALGILDETPASGTRLRANVFRVERGRDGKVSAASLAPTREPDFHAMGDAVMLVLDEGAGS